MGKRGPQPAGEEARTERAPAMLQPSEKRRVKAAAEAAGVSVSTWLQRAAVAQLEKEGR